MKKRQKEAILIAFLQEKGKYKKIAGYFRHLIQDDPSSPKKSLHTIKYRLKDELRLIEKINILNQARFEVGTETINQKNYQESIGDLLGIRIICLRLSDIEKIEAYLKLLSEEKILHFVKGPDQKKSFIMPVASGEYTREVTDLLRYTGYSSIHYQIQLGENSEAPPELKQLQFELQLRTILEEAWSEIDHKYRYVRSRAGLKLPEHIHAGFYNLSAYLQVAAHQAEYLCRSAEMYTRFKGPKVEENAAIPLDDTTQSVALEAAETPWNISILAIEAQLEEILGVKVTLRTLIYIEKRLREVDLEEAAITLRHVFKENRLVEFKTIFQEIMGSAPFLKEKECSIDAINALNFTIFYELEGKRVAREGLRVVLKWRKAR